MVSSISRLLCQGAVRLLQKIGCDYLCFGTEGEQSFDYQAFGSFVQENQKRIDQAFLQLVDQTMSYPQKMTEVFNQLYPEMNLDFSSPNHILGLSYAKENACYDRPMQLVPIARKNAGYHDQELPEQQIASATAIRKALSEKEQSIIMYQLKQPKFFSLPQCRRGKPIGHYSVIDYCLQKQKNYKQFIK